MYDINNPIVKLSYSDLRDLVICPMRWELINVKGVKPDFDLRRFLVPNVIDQAFTDWVNQGFPDNQLLILALARFDMSIKTNFIRWKHPLDQQEERERTRRAAWNLEFAMRQRDMCRVGATSQNRIKLLIDTVKLTGRPDIIYHDSLEIYDVKTTEDKKWLDFGQLHYYAMAISAEKRQRISKVGFLAPLMDPVVQPCESTKEDWKNIVTKIKAAEVSVRTKQFPPTGLDNDACYMCLVKRACPAYNKPVNAVAKGTRFKVSI